MLVKLLFAIKRLDSAAGGAERVFCTVCSSLVSRGHEVSILTFDSPEGKSFYPLDTRIRRIDLAIGDSSQSAGLIETLTRMRALRRVVGTERPDVVVGFMHSMFVPMAFALIGMGIPLIGSEHIVPEHYRKRRIQYLLLILATPLMSKLTVLSESIRLCYPRVLSRWIVVMPNPVELASNLSDVGTAKEVFTLLSVGRLDEQKDHATLIRAFSKIANQFQQWHLKIVGEGAMRFDLEKLVTTLGLQNKVSMPGTTPAIVEEYLAAEIFVMPSRYEAFGLATAEAMSHGLPVVGFADCPGTNELIESAKSGLLVEPGIDRVSALAVALSDLMTDSKLRQRLGSAGREAINTKFSGKQVCSKWESLLNSIVGIV